MLKKDLPKDGWISWSYNFGSACPKCGAKPITESTRYQFCSMNGCDWAFDMFTEDEMDRGVNGLKKRGVE